MKRVIAFLMILLIGASIITGCSSGSSNLAKPGECMWCHGAGYSLYKDASGQYVRKTCSHCHGTGRS